MKKPPRKTNREAVEKSLRELEILFGKKRPPGNDKNPGEGVLVGTAGSLKIERNSK